MEGSQKYLTGMIIAIVAIACGGLSLLRGAIKGVTPNEPDISYTMPRPKKGPLYTLLFGLEGREVQYKEVNPFKDKVAKDQKNTAKGSVRGDQKNAPKIAKKDGVVKNAKAGVPIPAPKKPEVKVNVVNSDTGGGQSGARNSDGLNPLYANSNPNLPSAPVSPDVAKTNEGALSPAQWRSLIVAQPTKENIAKLVEAFNGKEVDTNTFYLIMNDLLQSSNTDTQSAGLTLAQSVPSLKTFTVLNENYDRLSNTNKASADKYFLTYMQTSRLPILAMALKSSDASVVHRAALVMVTGLAQVKDTPGSKDNRPARGIVASRDNTYSQFIPILQQLIQSSDSSVAGLAQSALSQIQGLSNV